MKIQNGEQQIMQQIWHTLQKLEGLLFSCCKDK
jgi:hypothetical protein